MQRHMSSLRRKDLEIAGKRVLAALPDFRDIHVYGGLVIIGLAGGTWGWVFVGLALWYLGVFRLE